LFFVVDNGSSHRGRTSVVRMRRRDKRIILVHTPVHASWLNQVLQPIMPLDLPVKVRSWELTVYPRSYIRRWLGVTRPAKART
jgi:hypothetical protein